MAGCDAARAEPKWYDRGLVWLTVVALGVTGALAASLLAERRTGDDEPPLEPETFCNTATELRGFDEIDPQLGVDTAELRRVQLVALRLRSLAPGSVADDFGAVVDGLGEVISVAEALPPDDPDGIAAVVTALNEQGAATADESARAAAYIERWCGFDPLEDPPATSVADPAPDAPAATGASGREPSGAPGPSHRP